MGVPKKGVGWMEGRMVRTMMMGSSSLAKVKRDVSSVRKGRNRQISPAEMAGKERERRESVR